MRSMITEHYLAKAQNVIYYELNTYSEEHTIIGRLVSIPAAIGDVTLQTLKTPLKVIEYIAFAAINLLGSAFHNDCYFKDALFNTEYALSTFIASPVILLMAPIKLVIQIFAGFYDPRNVKSINYFPSLGDDDMELTN